MASSGCSSSSMASRVSWVARKMGSPSAKAGSSAGRSGSGSGSASGSGYMAARTSFRTFSGMEPPSYTGR